MRRRYTSRLFDRKSDNRDRIEKAVALIEKAMVEVDTEGSFLVFSESSDKAYRVTLISCECEDFHFNTPMCKHQWASWGAPAAKMILRIRRAYDTLELEGWARTFADTLCAVPEPFLAIVREEYRNKLESLYDASKERRTA